MTDELNVNINWLAIPHQQLYDNIHNGPGVAGADTAQTAYRRLWGKFVDIRDQVNKGITALGGA